MSSPLATCIDWLFLLAFVLFKEHVSVHKVLNWVLAISSPDIVVVFFFLLGNKG